MVYGIIRPMENPIIYMHGHSMENQRCHDACHGERMEQQWTPWKAMIHKFMVNMTKNNIVYGKIIRLCTKRMIL